MSGRITRSTTRSRSTGQSNASRESSREQFPSTSSPVVVAPDSSVPPHAGATDVLFATSVRQSATTDEFASEVFSHLAPGVAPPSPTVSAEGNGSPSLGATGLELPPCTAEQHNEDMELQSAGSIGSSLQAMFDEPADSPQLPPVLLSAHAPIDYTALAAALYPMLEGTVSQCVQSVLQIDRENKRPQTSMEHYTDEDEPAASKKRRVRSSSSPSSPYGEQPPRQSSEEPAVYEDTGHPLRPVAPLEPIEVKRRESGATNQSSVFTTETVPLPIVLACLPDERERYGRRRGVVGTEDSWLAEPFAKWYLREGVSHIVQAWARNFREIQQLKKQAEENQRIRKDDHSDCEEVECFRLDDPSWISPRTVDPARSSRSIRALWPRISQKEGDRLMNIIPKFDLGSKDPELNDFCAYYARYRHTLSCQGTEVANYILVQSVDMDSVRALHSSFGNRLPLLETHLLARYMGQAIYRRTKEDLLQKTRELRLGECGCHTVKDLNQRVVDLIFCRYDKCSAVELCTSMVYGLSYHMPGSDRHPFYQKVEAIYPTVMEAAMGHDADDMPTVGRQFNLGQKGVPKNSEEAEEFAEFLVKVASRRFSRATEAARFREVLVGTSQGSSRAPKVSSTSAQQQQQKKPKENEQGQEPRRSDLKCTFCGRSGHSEEKCWRKHPALRRRRSEGRGTSDPSAGSWTRGDGRKPYWPGDNQSRGRGRGKRGGGPPQKPSASDHRQQSSQNISVPSTGLKAQLKSDSALIAAITAWAGRSSSLAAPQDTEQQAPPPAATNPKSEQDFQHRGAQ